MTALPRLLLLLGILLLTACGGGPEQPPLRPLLKDARILAFGDSLTHGTGASLEQAYPAELARMTGLEVINEGIPGEESAQGLARLPQLLDEYEPTLLLLCHGGNDLLRKRGEGALKENLRQMVQMARARGVQVAMLGVPRPELFSLESAELYAEVAQEFAVPIDTEVLARVIGERALRSDRVHPNAQGYRQIAEAVQALLHSAGAL